MQQPAPASVLLAALLLLLLPASGSAARDGIDYTLHPHMLGGADSPGIARQVVVRDHLAYLSDGDQGLRIYDVSVPHRPLFIRRVEALGDWSVGCLALHGDELLVEVSRFTTQHALRVLDLTDPVAPVIIGSLPLEDYASDLEVSGDLVYLGYFDTGFGIVDVSAPEAPVFLSVLASRGRVGSIVVHEGFAYFVDSCSGFLAVDVRDPADPSVTCLLDAGFGGPIERYGHYLYQGGATDDLWIVDLVDPARPVTAAFAPVAHSITGLLVVDDHLLAAEAELGLRVYSLADPLAPAATGAFSTAHEPAGMQLHEGLLYVADHAMGLRVVDLGDFTAPPTLAIAPLDEHPWGAAAIGDIVLVADYAAGISVWDLADPRAPVQLPGGVPGRNHTIVVAGDIALATDIDDGLVVLDVSDPAAPLRRGSVDPGIMYDAAVDGDIAYIAAGWGGHFVVVDLADPDAPAILADVPTPQLARSIARLGHHAIVGDSQAGLLVFDCADPASPVQVGQCALPASPLDIVMKDSHALVAAFDAGMFVVDCSDPEAPELVHAFHPGGRPFTLELDGDVLYAATIHGGAKVIDVSDPLDPKILGDHRGADRARGVARTDQAVVVIDEDGAMHVLPSHCADGVTAVADDAPGNANDDSAASGTGWLRVTPNPANPQAMISLAVPRPQRVELDIYDLTGRRVVRLFAGFADEGGLTVAWNGRDQAGHAAASGVYLLRMIGESVRASHRLALVR